MGKLTNCFSLFYFIRVLCFIFSIKTLNDLLELCVVFFMFLQFSIFVPIFCMLFLLVKIVSVLVLAMACLLAGSTRARQIMTEPQQQQSSPASSSYGSYSYAAPTTTTYAPAYYSPPVVYTYHHHRGTKVSFNYFSLLFVAISHGSMLIGYFGCCRRYYSAPAYYTTPAPYTTSYYYATEAQTYALVYYSQPPA